MGFRVGGLVRVGNEVFHGVLAFLVGCDVDEVRHS